MRIFREWISSSVSPELLPGSSVSAVTLFPIGAEYSQKHDLYEYRFDSRDARCLEHGWGRLGLLGAALPAFTRRFHFLYSLGSICA